MTEQEAFNMGYNKGLRDAKVKEKQIRLDTIGEFVGTFDLEWLSRYADEVTTVPFKENQEKCCVCEFVDEVAKKLKEKNHG